MANSETTTQPGRLAVLGAGSWGTALAVLLGKKNYAVTLWGRPEDVSGEIIQGRQNVRYLPGVTFPQSLLVTSDLDSALDGIEAIVMVVPSTAVREVAARLRGRLGPETLLIHAGKGLESETGLRGSQIIAEELGEEIGRGCVALSGPNLAVELAGNVPTATVVASRDPDRAARAQDLFVAPSLRVYRNPDIAGVELGGALKNVVAIGAGIADGLGYGDNTKATVVTRGVQEMIRLGVCLGADARTFTGLSGLGDLMATCSSPLSRNLRLGRMVGQGVNLAEALCRLGQVAEGLHTCEAALLLSRKLSVSAPITEQVHAVLLECKDPNQAVSDLMARDSKNEFE